MVNMIRCKVIFQIKDSPRGSLTKMLVVRTPIYYNTSCAFVRQHGVDGLVLAYQANGIRPRTDASSGKKIWEFDDGLVWFPLKSDVGPIQVDAEIHGSNLLIQHLPPEIYNTEHYTEVPAPAQIPKNGTPVRIMKPTWLQLSQFNTESGWYLSVTMSRKLADQMGRAVLKPFGTGGFQIIPSDDGLKVSQNLSATKAAVKFRLDALPFRLSKSKIKSFQISAKYDEASQTIITEDAVDLLSQKAKESPTPSPETPRNRVGYLQTITPEERRESARQGGVARWANREPKASMDIIGLVALIEKHFKNGVYELEYDDARIATEAGMKKEFVAQIREAQFGPIKSPNAEAVAELRKKMKEIEKALAALGT